MLYYIRWVPARSGRPRYARASSIRLWNAPPLADGMTPYRTLVSVSIPVLTGVRVNNVPLDACEHILLYAVEYRGYILAGVEPIGGDVVRLASELRLYQLQLMLYVPRNRRELVGEAIYLVRATVPSFGVPDADAVAHFISPTVLAVG